MINKGPDEFPHHQHHGPITRGCPPQCLLDLLSRRAWNPLMRGDIGVSAPETVGDVLDLYASHRLRDVSGLGPRRIGEIATALVVAGFDLSSCPRPESSRSGDQPRPAHPG